VSLFGSFAGKRLTRLTTVKMVRKDGQVKLSEGGFAVHRVYAKMTSLEMRFQTMRVGLLWN
jgi:hypothetical protein